MSHELEGNPGFRSRALAAPWAKENILCPTFGLTNFFINIFLKNGYPERDHFKMRLFEDVQNVKHLQRGLINLNIKLSEEVQLKMVEFLKLISKWNKTINLTAITDPDAMVIHHLLDSLAIQPYLYGNRLIDVGSGSGLPGVPLALANPDKEFYLLESNRKKTRFLQQVSFELGIDNITVINARVEQYKVTEEKRFDSIISRAFTSLARMLQLTHHLCGPNGRFIAMKGKIQQQELEDIENHYTIVEIAKLKVPGLKAERHLIVIEESHRG